MMGLSLDLMHQQDHAREIQPQTCWHVKSLQNLRADVMSWLCWGRRDRRWDSPSRCNEAETLKALMEEAPPVLRPHCDSAAANL